MSRTLSHAMCTLAPRGQKVDQCPAYVFCYFPYFFIFCYFRAFSFFSISGHFRDLHSYSQYYFLCSLQGLARARTRFWVKPFQNHHDGPNSGRLHCTRSGFPWIFFCTHVYVVPEEDIHAQRVVGWLARRLASPLHFASP